MNQLAEPMASGAEQEAGYVTCGLSGKEIPTDEALRLTVWVTIRSKGDTWERNINIPVAPEYFGRLKALQDDPLASLQGVFPALDVGACKSAEGALGQDPGSDGLAPNAGGAPEAEQDPNSNTAA